MNWNAPFHPCAIVAHVTRNGLRSPISRCGRLKRVKKNGLGGSDRIFGFHAQAEPINWPTVLNDKKWKKWTPLSNLKVTLKMSRLPIFRHIPLERVKKNPVWWLLQNFWKSMEIRNYLLSNCAGRLFGHPPSLPPASEILQPKWFPGCF